MELLLRSGRRDSDARFAECAGDNRFEGLARPTILRILGDASGKFGMHFLNRHMEVVAAGVKASVRRRVDVHIDEF